MVDKLGVGKLSEALNSVTASMQVQYGRVFTTLQADLATIVRQLGTIQWITVTGELTELAIVRNGVNAPETFQVYLIRSEDGIWRIDGM